MNLAKIIMSFWLLSGCAHTALPHRPVLDLFPQANSPPAECPHQYHMDVSNMDGTWFLYCFGVDN